MDAAEKNIQQRLESAAYCLIHVRPDELPEELREEFRAVWYELTKISGSEGSIRATAHQLTTEEGSDLAERLRVMAKAIGEAEPQLSLQDIYPTTLQYQPYRDGHWKVVEDETDYIRRMRAGPLSNWPEEVLKEWLYRHANDAENYGYLGLPRFRFEAAMWDVNQIPGRDAFEDERFCDDFQNVEERASENKDDWLAHYMMREGTWNTPIVLLRNRKTGGSLEEAGLKSPYHLLEGHRRLSFLQGLKRLNIAKAQHSLWLVRLASGRCISQCPLTG